MREDRLLERIRARQEEPRRQTGEDPKRAIDSVLNHLQRILNTRQGSVPIGEDYGVPDLTDFKQVYPDGVRDLERSIKQTIEKYEPRLKSIRVKFVPQEDEMLSVSFQILARLVLEEQKDVVVFQSILDSDGKIRITR